MKKILILLSSVLVFNMNHYYTEKIYCLGDLMKKKSVFIICIILIVGILTVSFDVRLKTVVYTIKTPKITEKMKIALVADLHSCSYGKNQNRLLNEIEKYQPDAVMLGGDIFDDVLDDNNARVFIEKMAEKYKTYYVSGNHEWWSGGMQSVFDYLSSKGVVVLRGNSELLKIGENVITISGIDDPEVNRYDSTHVAWEEQLEQAGESLESNHLNILLTHRPEYANEYFRYDFDVVLSGHAHGGQFRIPFILNGLYAPNQGFFPKLAGGIYDFDGRKLIVSRGLARESTRLPRIFNRPELVFVNLITQ